MDQNGIRSVKNRYRTVMLRRTIQALQALIEEQDNSLTGHFVRQGRAGITHRRAAHTADAIQVLNESWVVIGVEIIVNVCRKARA